MALPAYLTTATAWICGPFSGTALRPVCTASDVPRSVTREIGYNCADLAKLLKSGKDLLPEGCQVAYIGQEEDPTVKSLKRVCEKLGIRCVPTRAQIYARDRWTICAGWHFSANKEPDSEDIQVWLVPNGGNYTDAYFGWLLYIDDHYVWNCRDSDIPKTVVEYAWSVSGKNIPLRFFEK